MYIYVYTHVYIYIYIYAYTYAYTYIHTHHMYIMCIYDIYTYSCVSLCLGHLILTIGHRLLCKEFGIPRFQH